MSWKKEVEEIKRRQKLSLDHGGEESIKLQHEKGRKTLRERINLILDDKSFDEVGKLAGSPDFDNEGKLKNFIPSCSLITLPRIFPR